MGFSRQEFQSGLPCPPPGDPSDPGIEPRSPALQADSLMLSHQGSPISYYVGHNKPDQNCRIYFAAVIHDSVDQQFGWLNQ